MLYYTKPFFFLISKCCSVKEEREKCNQKIFNQVYEEIDQIHELITRGTLFLPAYDVRTAQEKLKKLQEKL